MTDATRVLVRLSAALGRGDQDALVTAMDDAAAMAQAEAVEEVLLESYLFLGFPAALNGLKLWRRRTGRAAPAAAPDDWPLWQQRGVAVCRQVYAGHYDRLREVVAALHPDLEHWMIVEGYGKVLGRPGLELRQRELCAVAMLAAQSAEPQLYAHLRGTLNTGTARQDVAEAVALIGAGLDDARRTSLERIWEHVQTRHGD